MQSTLFFQFSSRNPGPYVRSIKTVCAAEKSGRLGMWEMKGLVLWLPSPGFCGTSTHEFCGPQTPPLPPPHSTATDVWLPLTGYDPVVPLLFINPHTTWKIVGSNILDIFGWLRWGWGRRKLAAKCLALTWPSTPGLRLGIKARTFAPKTPKLFDSVALISSLGGVKNQSIKIQKAHYISWLHFTPWKQKI